MNMSERLQRWRGAKGWTLEQASAHLRISIASYRNYENGAEPKNAHVRAGIERVLGAWERVNA